MKLLFCIFFLATVHICLSDTLIYRSKTLSYMLNFDSVLSADKVNYDCIVRTIVIIRLVDNKVIQTIQVKENHAFCPIQRNECFIIEDVNFDGHEDIRLLQFMPASPNLPYYFWVYDVRSKQFRADSSLENITSPIFDHKSKTIFSSWRDGVDHVGGDTYKYINGKITLTERFEIITDPDTDKQTEVTKKLVGGVFKEVSRKPVSIDH